MLTIDDINSIFEKYKDIGIWYEIDLTKLSENPNGIIIDGIQLIKTKENGNDGYRVHLPNPLYYGLYYFSSGSEVRFLQLQQSIVSGAYFFLETSFITELHLFLCMSDITPIPYRMQMGLSIIKPKNSLYVNVVNGEFDDKFYIDTMGNKQWIDGYTINDEYVELETDEDGDFLRLPSANDCLIGVDPDRSLPYNLYKVIFREFKTLPILSIPTIYKGNTQTIQLLDDTEEITEFQAYYKGELLNDNKITLPYDADDYIDITVDLLDNRYPNSTLKLKAPTMMYTANSQSDVETAISQGITTLQVGDTETEVSLNGIDLTNVQLVNSHIQLNNCTLTDCQLIQSTYTDNGANNITDTNFNECEITTTQVSTYNNCAVSECTVTDSELHITGTLNNNTFNNSLIVSDGEITLTNNTFTGIGSKTYFPSHLYLTGDYIVSGNTFNLTGTFTELQFNMCLIKATNEFNVSEFINKNSFNLNITYGEENPSTLYYNIVDDDKIRARRI